MNTQVSPAELRLTNGADTLVIRPRRAAASDPIMCKQWDLGAPDTRYTATPNPGADGVSQGRGFLGSRTVTLDLQILGGMDPITGQVHDAYWYASKLAAMAHPQAAPQLSITRTGGLIPGKPATMDLRGNPFSLAYGQRAAAMLEMQLSFICPSGLINGPLQSFSTADFTGVIATDWHFPATFPKGFGVASGTYPSIVMDVGGSAAVTPVIYISGPVTDPELQTEQGERFRFDGLTLIAGQTIQIDMGAGALRLADSATGAVNDDGTAYLTVDWEASTFWTWLPGRHTLHYNAASGVATVQYREQWLTI